MALTIQKSGSDLKKLVSPSNKHGLKESFLAYAVELPTGNTVSVSRPMIDRITLIGAVPPSVYGVTLGKNGEPTSEGVRQFARTFKRAMKDPDCGLTKSPFGKSSAAKGYPKKGEKVAFIKVGPRNARVDVRAQPKWGTGGCIVAWRLRLDWNPRKAGREGLEQLWELLVGDLLFHSEGANEWFRRAEVTRLDIAVDLIGAQRSDLFTVMPLQKKIVSHGRWATGLETVTHLVSEGPKGKAGLVVYDKRQERLDAKKDPKYGDLPHQRIERRLAFTGGKGPVVGSLAAEKDRLSDLTIRLMRDLPDGLTKTDQQIVAGASLWLGSKQMTKCVQGSHLAAWKVLRTPDHAFWNTSAIWKHWPSAVADAGLARFAGL